MEAAVKFVAANGNNAIAVMPPTWVDWNYKPEAVCSRRDSNVR